MFAAPYLSNRQQLAFPMMGELQIQAVEKSLCPLPLLIVREFLFLDHSLDLLNLSSASSALSTQQHRLGVCKFFSGQHALLKPIKCFASRMNTRFRRATIAPVCIALFALILCSRFSFRSVTVYTFHKMSLDV